MKKRRVVIKDEIESCIVADCENVKCKTHCTVFRIGHDAHLSIVDLATAGTHQDIQRVLCTWMTVMKTIQIQNCSYCIYENLERCICFGDIIVYLVKCRYGTSDVQYQP